MRKILHSKCNDLGGGGLTRLREEIWREIALLYLATRQKLIPGMHIKDFYLK
jgi:hypothetical protein